MSQNIETRLLNLLESSTFIQSLHFDEIPLFEITYNLSSLIDKCMNLTVLSFNSCQLTSLKNLPHPYNLLRLELDSNPIDPLSFSYLIDYKALLSLSIGNNPKLKNIKDLVPLANYLPNLRQLDIEGSPFCEVRGDYRREIFEMFPKLEYLDNLTQKGEEVRIEDKELLEELALNEEIDQFGIIKKKIKGK